MQWLAERELTSMCLFPATRKQNNTSPSLILIPPLQKMSQHAQSTATVLEALQALYHDPHPEAKKKANEWLEEFQHSVSLGFAKFPYQYLLLLLFTVLPRCISGNDTACCMSALVLTPP